MMGLQYKRVPEDEMLHTSDPSDQFQRSSQSPRRLSKLGKLRIVNLILFFVSFVCCVFTLLSIATAGEPCFDYHEGFARVTAERNHLRNQVALLQAQLNISR